MRVNGRKVAYLSRDWASKFNAALASNGYTQAACNALIVGGWDRGGHRGNFGIKLPRSASRVPMARRTTTAICSWGRRAA
jgi:hypothetical protein